MRKFITIIAIAVSITASAQKDSTKKDSLSADTKFLSITDVFNYSEFLKDKVTARQYETYAAMLNEMLKSAVADYYKKKEKPKK